MKINIIYWTSTGNTEKMAEGILKGIDGHDGRLVYVTHAKTSDVLDADLLLLGASAMGVEEIDDSEMLPFLEANKEDFKGKKVALFGAYDWGDGEWMRNWESLMQDYNTEIVSDSLIYSGAPDQDGMTAFENYGSNLIKLLSES